MYSCTITNVWKVLGSSSHVVTNFWKSKSGDCGQSTSWGLSSLVFYSFQLMGQVVFPHASGGSLRHSSMLEGGNLHSSKGRQHLWSSAVPCSRWLWHLHKPSSVEQDRCCQCILGCSCGLGTLSVSACEEPHRWAREEALSYAYFQNYLLSWASATASSLGQ